MIDRLDHHQDAQEIHQIRVLLRQQEEEPMFIIRQHNGFNTRQGFNAALRLALELRELGWACCIENADGQVIAE